MHGHRLVELFRVDDLQPRTGQFRTHHQCQQTAHQEESECGDQIEVPDLLVIGGRQPVDQHRPAVPRPGGRRSAWPVSVTIRCAPFFEGVLGPAHDARAGAQSEVALRSVPVGSGGGRPGGRSGGRPGRRCRSGRGSGKRGDVRKMCAECVSLDNFPAADKERQVRGIRNLPGIIFGRLAAMRRVANPVSHLIKAEFRLLNFPPGCAITRRVRVTEVPANAPVFAVTQV